MAELVGAFGVPHMALREQPNGELAQLFGAVRRQVDAVNPDVLVVFDTDHFAMWYYQRLPVFAVGVAEETCGRHRRFARLAWRSGRPAGRSPGHVRCRVPARCSSGNAYAAWRFD